VYGQKLAAFWTGPFFFFFSDEFSYAELLDIFLILNHAHGIFCSVSLVQLLHSGTGKCITVKTEFGFELFSLFAHSYPAANTSFRLIRVNQRAAGAFIFLPDITDTQPAIHPARCDKSRFHCFRLCWFSSLHLTLLYGDFFFIDRK